MKHAFQPLILLLALAGLTLSAHAQVQGPPALVDYQGTIYDSAGKPYGSAGTAPNLTPAPENKTMEFRVYDVASGGSDANVVWAETQTVTVSLGQFSVRLGSGAQITAPTSLLHGSLAEAFDGKERFLEVTVINPGQTPSPILPRLAFQSSPFSFVAGRAKVADEVIGKVTAATGSTFAGTVNAAGATFTGGTYEGNGAGLTGLTASQIPNLDASKITGILNKDRIPILDSGKIQDGTIATADLANGSVTAVKLGSDVGLWSVSGANVYRSSGNVGITGSMTIEAQGTTPVIRLQDLSQYSNYYWDITSHTGNLGFVSGSGAVGIFNFWTAAYTSVSDRSLKKHIKPMVPSLDRLLQLQPVSYQFKPQKDDAPVSFGFIAQDVQPLFPEVVETMPNGKLGLTYSEMIPITVAALQELKSEKDAEIAALKTQISALHARDKMIEAMQARIEAFEARSSAIEAKLGSNAAE